MSSLLFSLMLFSLMLFSLVLFGVVPLSMLSVRCRRPAHHAGPLAMLWLALCGPAMAQSGAPEEHDAFTAALSAPFDDGGAVARRIRLDFSAALPPSAAADTMEAAADDAGAQRGIAWRLALLSPAGRELRHWSGSLPLPRHAASIDLRWVRPQRALPAGVYQLYLRATLRAPGAADEIVEQRSDIRIGRPAPAMLPEIGDGGGGLARPRAAGPPVYEIYYGNLHSHSNHSDGGGALDDCHGAQPPQQGRFGPADAWSYAREHGLDFLVTSEHNHMYDGSDGLNAEADPAAVRALFHSGLDGAAAFNAAHAGFLAVYGDEWGVIHGGGHVNIFNGDQLAGWEVNARGQLLAEAFVAKSDYAALYTLMRQRGWLGQFNHPAATGQFRAAGADLGYTADGDAAIALCEVLNSAAFSNRTDEGEPALNNYESACNKALEAGYHVAFSSDQDNHCANWGASSGNRTGLLLPKGTALTSAGFTDAIAARRVFATMDRQASILLTANGHTMGERFDNAGPLQLQVAYTHAGAPPHRVAAVRLMEGVPGRRGQVTLLARAATARVMPTPGPHFYYARLTQDDGKVLWSAPVWINQANP